jgi:hypothetical protein
MSSSFLRKFAEKIKDKRISIQVKSMRIAGVPEEMITAVVDEAKNNRNFGPLYELYDSATRSYIENAKAASRQVTQHATAMMDEVEDQLEAKRRAGPIKIEPRF